MFASRSLTEHLTRGAIGIGAFTAALTLGSSRPWLSIALLPVAFVALRGCPTCWTMGLVETVIAKVRGRRRSSAAACLDGRCALKDSSAIE